MRSQSVAWAAIAVALIVVLAAAIRFPFLGDGLPYIYNVDDMNRVRTVMSMLARRSLDPEFFSHPAQTVLYPMAAIAALVYLGGLVGNVFSNAREFALWFYSDPSTLYLAWTSYIFAISVLTVAATFLLARRYAGTKAAVVAALCVALAPNHIAASSLLRSSDIVMSLFFVLSVYFAMRSRDIAAEWGMNRAAIRYLVISGLFVGFATASKFYGVFAALAIATAHLFLHGLKWRRLKFLALAAGCSVLGAFLVGPFMFIEFRELIADVMIEGRSTHLSATAPGFLEDIRWFLARLVTGSLGPILSIAALVGLAAGFARRWRDTAILIGAPLVFLLFLAYLPLRWERWMHGLIPFAAIFAGAGVVATLEFLTGRFGVAARRGAFAIALPLILSWSLTVSIQSVQALSHPRTQDVARAWIEANIDPGARIYVEGHGPWLDSRTYLIIPRFTTDETTPYDFVDVQPPIMPLTVDFGFLRRNRVEYVIKAGWEDRMRVSRFPERFAETLAIYDELNRNAVTVFDTADQTGETRGKRIQVLSLVGCCRDDQK